MQKLQVEHRFIIKCLVFVTFLTIINPNKKQLLQTTILFGIPDFYHPGEYNVSPRFYGLLGTLQWPIVGWVTLYDNKRLPLNGRGIPQRYRICTAVSRSGWPSLRTH